MSAPGDTLDVAERARLAHMVLAEAGYPNVECIAAGDHVEVAGAVPAEILYRAGELVHGGRLPICVACYVATATRGRWCEHAGAGA